MCTASDKPDLGLDELQNLNVKERFQVFQHQNENENGLERTPSAVNVKRSPSILSKLARFQQKGKNLVLLFIELIHKLVFIFELCPSKANVVQWLIDPYSQVD